MDAGALAPGVPRRLHRADLRPWVLILPLSVSPIPGEKIEGLRGADMLRSTRASSTGSGPAGTNWAGICDLLNMIARYIRSWWAVQDLNL